jgi:uncharacterized protein (TIGR02757 family)
MNTRELKQFLDYKSDEYNRPEFISSDPVQIPHRFSKKEDIEISGFLTATIAWGQRKSIIKNSLELMQLMNEAPYEFVMNHEEKDLIKLQHFVHRTFNSQDLICFIHSLRHLYTRYQGMENIFQQHAGNHSLQGAIHEFKQVFFELPHPARAEKHVSDPLSGSAAKRINMFLRWMVRRDNRGVDLGIWKSLSPSQLSCPLDVHSGQVARKLGLITRTQNDAKALVELDANLRRLDAEDPVKYDFALFGLGVFEKF